MKKLLILMLVLCLASAANAALTLISSAGTTLNINDTTEIGIYNDTAETQVGKDMWVMLQLADVAKGSFDGTGAIYRPPTIATPGGALTFYGVISPYGDLVHTDLGIADVTSVWGTGVLAGLDFTCDAIGDVLITLYEDDMATVIDSITITQVPEPMTIALLGLGGLFLRRRK